ncbi:glycoside hydrolase family 3 protein [Putridiphycobacter roseus]|uniref:beta-N-acetylhexosaminidase n=1 Tax=Putridiphycobacter roseus TaxID=2219161 RepID=A0A2W1NMA4_9FLAO|nr:glycoside hydrolase family 3 N-terminal domain-containing protein [Putridiphycobacter roseus]PZE15808.1 glycoside hydrolase family 3 protein [Putridiphycobacter roseus]
MKYFLLMCSFGFITSCFAFGLNDFYKYNAKLAQKTDSVYQTLTKEERVAQMIVVAAGRLGQPASVIEQLITKNKIGGIILLNGTMQGFTEMKLAYQKLNKGLPMIFSADAEPSLIAYKIKGSSPVKKANAMLSREEVLTYTEIICKDLKKIGIQYNYAPVVDMSPNKVVSSRSFGNNADTAQAWAKVFIETSQKNGIVATAKHFPGHGYVVGDTHKQLVYINGEMKEVKNYIPLINSGVISIMVGHIAVKNNAKYETNDLPATCSKKMVTGLLKNELNFEGIVITDAMNMGGVVKVPQCELKAAQAGCDIILMPVNAAKAIQDIVNELSIDADFEQQIAASVKKIIRLKICLGLIH